MVKDRANFPENLGGLMKRNKPNHQQRLWSYMTKQVRAKVTHQTECLEFGDSMFLFIDVQIEAQVKEKRK